MSVRRKQTCCSMAVPMAGGVRQAGEEWTCPTCRTTWVHDVDEAEGCCWLLKPPPRPRRQAPPWPPCMRCSRPRSHHPNGQCDSYFFGADDDRC